MDLTMAFGGPRRALLVFSRKMEGRSRTSEGHSETRKGHAQSLPDSEKPAEVTGAQVGPNLAQCGSREAVVNFALLFSPFLEKYSKGRHRKKKKGSDHHVLAELVLCMLKVQVSFRGISS